MLGWKYEYHSLEQIEFIQQLSKRTRLQTREALYLATQLVNHGFPSAYNFLRRLQEEIPSKPVQDYLNRLEKRNKVIQNLPALRQLLDDQQVVREMYEGDGFIFRPGSHRRDIAVVIFTTKFNNFTFSNIVVDAAFDQLGVARLFLRDRSDFVYFRGVKGLAESLLELPTAISRLLEQQNIRAMILTGYSSGGFPSCYIATRMKSVGYIGYSISTDISPDTTLPKRSMYEKLANKLDGSIFIDLKKEIADGRTSSYSLYYGQREPKDRAHAKHLEGVKGVRVVSHEHSGHEVTAHLLEDGQFLEPFSRLLEQETSNE